MHRWLQRPGLDAPQREVEAAQAAAVGGDRVEEDVGGLRVEDRRRRALRLPPRRVSTVVTSDCPYKIYEAAPRMMALGTAMATAIIILSAWATPAGQDRMASGGTIGRDETMRRGEGVRRRDEMIASSPGRRRTARYPRRPPAGSAPRAPLDTRRLSPFKTRIK
jgi:hypothetical protein